MAALKWVTEQRYLGVFISNNNSDDDHDIQRQMRSTYCRGNISSKFRKCTDEVKVQLLKFFCINVYCGSWSTYSKSTCMYDRLCVAYNNNFRGLLQLNRRGSTCISKAFIDNNGHCFNVPMRKDIFSPRNIIYMSYNKLIGAITSSHFFISYMVAK